MEKTCDKITPEVLKAAVSKEHNVSPESVEIENISIKAGSKKGDGFACEIAAVQFEATFNGQKLEKNYIAKYAPDGHRGEMLKFMKAFEQEGRTYTWFIPNLQKLREEKNLNLLAFPKCFYASDEDSLILLENLKVQNFEVVVKKPEPLSLNAVKLVLKELAAFHATGLHFINTYPGGREALALEYPDMFTENFVLGKDAGEEMMYRWFDITAKMFGSCVLVTKKYGSEELSTKMADYQKQIRSIMDKLFNTKWRMSYVTHGDAWYNNFLCRYSPDNRIDPIEVSIVDLQNTRLGRPGLELAYFFCSSTSPQQRREHFQTLLKLYYNQFCEELKNLGDKTGEYFTYDALLEDFDECYPFGFIMGCVHSQIHLVNETSEVNFDIDSFGDDAAASRMMGAMEVELLAKAEASPAYRELVIGLAEEALERKVI